MQTALRTQGLRPDKGLGQHFLADPTTILRIVKACRGAATLVEIGPGPGVLTRPLGALEVPIIALEIDERIAPVARKLAPDADVRIGDAMTADFSSLLLEGAAPRTVVSNLPYYVTHPLTERILAVREHWSSAVLMMQREVAEKWRARPGDRRRGSFSVFLQAVCEVETIALVPASAFLPPPKVDSIVLRLTPRPGAEWPDGLDRFVRQGFSQPRKTLTNCLATYGKERIAALLRDPLARAQDLTETEWRDLYVEAISGTGVGA